MPSVLKLDVVLLYCIIYAASGREDQGNHGAHPSVKHH